MIDRYPALTGRPTTTEDVSMAIRFARERELTLACCGAAATAFPGFSTCDDGMVIDLSRMLGA